MAVIGGFNFQSVLTSCKTAISTNVNGVYDNGPSLNGVDATLTTTASIIIVDGIKLQLFDRIILAGQTDTTQNGIYYYSSVDMNQNIIFTRVPDLQSSQQVVSGLFGSVEAGTTKGGDIFTIQAPNPFVFGVSSMTFDFIAGSASGTVTEVDTGTGLTGGPITSSGTISLATIANNDILSNISGGVAAPLPNTLSATIDSAIGSTQGDILYRGASVWSALAPSTSGTFLQSSGASANPAWSPHTLTLGANTTISSSGIITSPSRPGFSAYLSAGVANVTGDGTNYAIPFDTFDFTDGNYAGSTYTFPVSGIYLIQSTWYLNPIGAGHTLGFAQWNLGGSHTFNPEAYIINPAAIAASSSLLLTGSFLYKATAGDIIQMITAIENSTKTVGTIGTRNGCLFSILLLA